MVAKRCAPIGLSWDRAALVGVLARSLPVCVSTVLVTWLLQGPIVLSKPIIGDSEAIGQLAVTLQLLVLSASFPVAVGLASLPAISRSAQRQDGKDLLFARVMFRAAFAVGGALGFLAWGLAPALVVLVLGESYREAGELLRWALWLMIPMILGNASLRVLEGRGHYLASSLAAMAGAVVLTASLPDLVAALGAQGALFAAGLGMLVWCSLALLILGRKAGTNLTSVLLRPALTVAAAAAVCALLAPYSPSLAVTAALLMLALVGYFGGLISASDRSRFGDLLRASLGRPRRP